MIEEKGVKDLSITKKMRNAFLDYAMSVNISRSIPDVRDGLKPVHRRILWAMFDLGMIHTQPYKKSARIVGEVIGKYHPHGDASVYDSMVRMSQIFSLRDPLIDGHGNWGSIDGDPAAAMRYTEARLTRLAGEMLKEIRKNTVDFQDNFDGEEREPTVLPARYPNLLVNGSQGIGVGLASNIPTHNLREICNGAIAMVNNPDITVDGLMEHIQGPDFPTGAIILGRDGIRKAYETGRGSIAVRAKIEEKVERDGSVKLIVTQIPYQTDIPKLLETIRTIQEDYDDWERESKKKNARVEQKGLDFIQGREIFDFTDKENTDGSVNIVIGLKKDVRVNTVINYLYKKTPLQSYFSVNNLSLVPEKRRDSRTGETVTTLSPKVLTLKETLYHYLNHQKEVVTRKYEFDLKKAESDIYFLQALMKALDKMDDVVEAIKTSSSKSNALERLIAMLDIALDQAEYILEKRLQTLAAFEQDSLRDEHQELAKKISEIQAVLSSEIRIMDIIKTDLADIASKYGTDRKTAIEDNFDEISYEDTITNDEMVVTISHNGFIKRTLESVYRTQRRKGRGVNAMALYEDDFIRHLQIARNKDTILFFTNLGKVYRTKVYQVPDHAKGRSIRSLLDLGAGEDIQAVLSITEFSEDQNLFFVTKNGIAKKSKLSDYENIRVNGIKAIELDEGDRVVGVSLTNGDRNVTLVTGKGMSITFEESEVKRVGRAGKGVKGISLGKGDSVVSFIIHEEDADLFIATSEGFGKRTPLSDYRVQSRKGKGVVTVRLTDKNGKVIGASTVQDHDTLMLITKNGTLMKLLVDEISQFNRNTQGTKIINLREADELSVVCRIPDDNDDE